MLFKIKWLQQKAGRKKGHVEELSDESIVRTWKSAGFIEIVKSPKEFKAPPVDKMLKETSAETKTLTTKNAPVKGKGK